ncbi:DNA/RNA non-specific endonuclease [Microbacterium sp. G2-8]|uniref:DNA/RNA non-specific endonuclease n=1 Tax=Microbacterium sp. G2-8 TaxID=2842454 RepID=UPI001C89321F|nr:DNA/RNA non-specific endonuclease [Microbacterium sp. G2-8]
MADGYDPSFLATDVPLPSSAVDTRELDYPRFTVLLDPMRRFAVVTAVNIDGAALRSVPRTGSWRLDSRVAAEEQAGPEIYTHNDLDRGHLVRRLDPGWGDAEVARDATEATFVYTNAAPQAAAFNQSKELWLGLEDHVLEYAAATDQKVSVFTAPILADGDPAYRGIHIPLRFWKVAAWQGADGVAAAGFILDQSELVDTRQGVLTVAPLGAYRTFQVPVADIAGQAGVDVGLLARSDVLAQESFRTQQWRELTSRDDLVLRSV